MPRRKSWKRLSKGLPAKNAHITVRPAQWWKGAVDLVASAWPDVTAILYCSEAYNKATRFEPVCFRDLCGAPGFVR